MVFMLAGWSLCTVGNVHCSLLSPELKNRAPVKSPHWRGVDLGLGLQNACLLLGEKEINSSISRVGSIQVEPFCL